MVFGEGKCVGTILESIGISMQVLIDAYYIYYITIGLRQRK